MNELKKDTTHLIVEFVKQKRSINEESLVDLVPRSWLKFTSKWICYFPEKRDWPKIDRWAKISKNAEQDWKAWEVVILKEAGMLQLEQYHQCLQYFYVSSML